MLRISPFWRSSPEDEITSSLLGGESERTLLISVPSLGGDVPLFDIAKRKTVRRDDGVDVQRDNPQCGGDKFT